MWKHVIASSIQSAFVGALLLIIVSLPSYGGAATIFGFIAFPIALVVCLLLAYPLIRLWQFYSWSNWVSFVVYTLSGFVCGFFTPVVMFGVSGTEFSFQSITFLSVYGGLGLVCSLSAWSYVRKNVAL
ncbi:hypothetical protein [Halioxenophilus sp. WMMB6]|uniref:hypothetical protein n=1 Tax=Halioxenophilus sp. WMMB6 TaxID=3073815 RepID=UPI00295EF46D|nr:hypothetical protein [Halioxenophilus sp. WMMB6]